MAVRSVLKAGLILSNCLAGGGCIYSGGQTTTLDRAGIPVGLTAVSVPFEKLVRPAPAPVGFSSTYQKQLLDRQRLARRQAERDAQAKKSGTDQNGTPVSTRPVSRPPAP